MTEQMMPIWLKKRTFLTPDRTAVKLNEESWTFAEINEWAERTARKLKTLGLNEGDFVALILENEIQMIIMFHALQYIGAVMVPLNTRLTVSELTWQLRDCRAKVLVYDNKHAKVAVDTMESGVSVIDFNELEKKEETLSPLRESMLLSDLHTIIYTSGTTGSPKGVQLNYGNHWWSAVSSALNLGLSEEDIWLSCVPLFHVSGLSILVKSVVYGIPVHLVPKFDASVVNKAIGEDHVTMISVVSVMLKQLLDDLGSKSYPEEFRCMLLGGGPAPKTLLEKCKAKNIPVYQTYGLSETASQIVTLSPEYSLTKLGSAGKSLFPAQIKIEEEGQLCKPHEPGEIVVSGPNVTIGYLNNDKATSDAIKEGWLYTGDIGYMDEQGFLYVLDRRKDLIISGGENVYPAEIESLLLKQPIVDDVGVTGVPDEKWGMVPVAFIKTQLNEAFNENELIVYCEKHLAKYKVPKKIIQVEELPRNASRKLLRRKLIDYLPKKAED